MGAFRKNHFCIFLLLASQPIFAQEGGLHEHPAAQKPALSDAILYGFDSPALVAEIEARLKMIGVALKLERYDELDVPAKGVLQLLENLNKRPITTADPKLMGIVAEMRAASQNFDYAAGDKRLSQLGGYFADMQAVFKRLRARLL